MHTATFGQSLLQTVIEKPLAITLLKDYTIKVLTDTKQSVQFFIGNKQVDEQTFSNRIKHEPGYVAGKMKASVVYASE